MNKIQRLILENQKMILRASNAKSFKLAFDIGRQLNKIDDALKNK